MILKIREIDEYYGNPRLIHFLPAYQDSEEIEDAIGMVEQMGYEVLESGLEGEYNTIIRVKPPLEFGEENWDFAVLLKTPND